MEPPPGASAGTGSAAADKEQCAATQRLVRQITVVAADSAGEGADSLPRVVLEGQQDAELAAAAEAEAGVAVSDDEELLEPPPNPGQMGVAKFVAAIQLMKDRKLREAAEMYSQAIQLNPLNAECYQDRGVAQMQLGREREAVQDFTVALELPCSKLFVRYQCLLFRGGCKERVGDLEGADEDYKAAHDAAPGPDERNHAMGVRRKLVAARVELQRKRMAAKEKQKPVVHRYRTVTLEEIDPEEGSAEHDEKVAHERAQAWQEAALKTAAQARGQALRLAQAYTEVQEQCSEENRKRADRNAVRAARRRSATEARQRQQAAAASAALQQGQGQQPAVAVERTRIPIEVLEPGLSCGSSFSSTSEASRSTGSRLAGYESESEGSEDEGQPAVAATSDAAEAEAAGAAAAAGPAPDAAGEASTSESTAAAQEDLAAASPAAAAAAAAATPPGTADAALSSPLLSEDELDALKQQADGLQCEGQYAAADKLYCRYLAQQPADLRGWSNRAENCCKAQRWQEALDCCNQALAMASPTHTVPRAKLFFKRGQAYRGAGRLLEALQDYEAAEVAAEEEGEMNFKKSIAKRTAALLVDMESRGIQPAPSSSGPALGLRASAVAAQVPLPAIPVVPRPPPHVVPDESELEGSTVGASQPSVAAVTASQRTPPSAAGGNAAAAAAVAGQARQADVSAEERDKGNACYKKRQWDLALRHYQRAAALDPSCKLALANQAAALLKLQRWEEAADAASKALAIDSGFIKARNRRAHAYAGQGLPDLALLDMRMVADAEPGDKAVQLDLKKMERAAQAAGIDLGRDQLFSQPKRAGQ